MFRKLASIFALCAAPAFADPAVIKHVTIKKSEGLFTFAVTIQHTDTGWDDYADAWRIKDEAGNILGERVLAHPHVNEQPFTRSLSGVKIPEGITTVVIEAHDTVNGWASGEKKVSLY